MNFYVYSYLMSCTIKKCYDSIALLRNACRKLYSLIYYYTILYFCDKYKSCTLEQPIKLTYLSLCHANNELVKRNMLALIVCGCMTQLT